MQNNEAEKIPFISCKISIKLTIGGEVWWWTFFISVMIMRWKWEITGSNWIIIIIRVLHAHAAKETIENYVYLDRDDWWASRKTNSQTKWKIWTKWNWKFSGMAKQWVRTNGANFVPLICFVVATQFFTGYVCVCGADTTKMKWKLI